ncbi:VOC family protein [Phragmitibacter flavus]|uniref:VOC family protein n=1 Tax=Phragmitibacter flavus TaxID=2576071 RepID=A0A5R8KFM4_9BACT|nr:VOC family protein [Phragmitibacter flavus]TLD71087.1 VOC family protein [Phragmitibacter flavus]
MNLPIIQPYLFFNGRCEEAINFYQTALDAKVDMVMKFSDSPEPPPPGMIPEGWEDKVMHASFTFEGNIVMASDGCEAQGGYAGFSLSLSVASAEEAKRYFDALSEGGEVTMPLGETFWSPIFGMLKDKFGVAWMVGVHVEPPAGC